MFRNIIALQGKSKPNRRCGIRGKSKSKMVSVEDEDEESDYEFVDESLLDLPDDILLEHQEAMRQLYNYNNEKDKEKNKEKDKEKEKTKDEEEEKSIELPDYLIDTREDWSSGQVCAWVHDTLGIHFSQDIVRDTIAIFAKHEIRGCVLHTYSEADLKDIGIRLSGVVKVLKMAIDDLE